MNGGTAARILDVHFSSTQTRWHDLLFSSGKIGAAVGWLAAFCWQVALLMVAQLVDKRELETDDELCDGEMHIISGIGS